MIEREISLKSQLSDEEDRVVDFLADKLGLTRSAMVRIAILTFCAEKEDLLSNWDKMIIRSKMGQDRVNSGLVG